VIARLIGRWGIRRKLLSLGVHSESTIKIKEKDSENIVITINGHIRKRTISLKLAAFVVIISKNDTLLSEKLLNETNLIPVCSFGDTEFLEDIFLCNISNTEICKSSYLDHHIELTHLPTTKSISGDGENAIRIKKTLTSNYPDLIIGIIDAQNIEEDLFLATQLIDLDVKLLLIITGIDELKEHNKFLDFDLLGKMLGTPILPYNKHIDTKEEDREKILKTLLNMHHNEEPFVRHIHINYGVELERSIHRLCAHIKLSDDFKYKVAPRFAAIRLLESDKVITNEITNCNACKERNCTANREINRLETLHDTNIQQFIDDSRRAYIKGGLKETSQQLGTKSAQKNEIILDNLFTHLIWGIPIFLFFVFITFFATFELGKYPMHWLEKGIGLLGTFIETSLPESFIRSMLVDGIIDGVGGMLIFLPNIFILFFFLGILENTGYLMRGAFLMDKYMHRIGLHGKSFIPMIMGFGCTVPAIMATRMLDDKRNRILTMLIVPFMSCSARLPVYVLMIAAFFPKHPTLMLFAVYAIGVLFAIILALIFNKTLFRKKEIPYIMQLPPYRKPRLHLLFQYTWVRGREYLKKIGGIILIASIIIWLMGYFPKQTTFSKDYDSLIAQSTDSAYINNMLLEKETEKQANSYIGKLGNFIQPVMQPLGFDWKMTVSVITGIAGKEIVVSTMGVLYQANNEANNNEGSLPQKLRSEIHTSGKLKGKPVINQANAFAFIMFILLYFPCIGVVAAIWKESGKVKWSIFTVIYTTSLAYIIALLVNQIGSLFL
jgi:ferrous iron transport protein B